MTQQPMQGGWGQAPQQPQQGGWGQAPAAHYAAPQPQQGYPAQQQQNPWGGQPQQQQAPAAPAIAPQQGDEFDDFFSGGVKGEPSFDWGKTQNAGKAMLGSTIAGIIVDMVQMQQTDAGTGEPKFYPKSGEPMMQVAITLQTDLRGWAGIVPDKIPVDPTTGQQKHPNEDQGLRRIYVKNDMKRAVTVACLQAGQKPRKGGKLAVKLSGFEDRGKVNPLPLYEAIYEKAPEDGGTAGFFAGAQAAGPGQPQAVAGQDVAQAGGFQQAPPAQQAPVAQVPAQQEQQPQYAVPQGQGYAPAPEQQNPSTLGQGQAPTAPPEWAQQPQQPAAAPAQQPQYAAPNF